VEVLLFRITHKGDFKKIDRFLDRVKRKEMFNRLNYICQDGVDALASATPVDTGLTAGSWSYDIDLSGDNVTITWSNSNIVNGYSVVMLIQYGHGTRGRTYVQGIDFINPAMKPVFDAIASKVWWEVRKA